MEDLQNPNTAYFIPPKPSLRGLLFGAVCRDTRGLELSHEQRFNFFPSSPLCTLTVVWHGQLVVVGEGCSSLAPTLPNIFASGPSALPTASWSSGPIHAITLCFYPDAWQLLTGQSAEKLAGQICDAKNYVPPNLLAILQELHRNHDKLDAIDGFQNQLEKQWRLSSPATIGNYYFVGDWLKSLIAATTLSKYGRSIRQCQRWIKSYSGLTKRELKNHMRLEALFARTRKMRDNENLADISFEMGFSDQSHMGREVRKSTGFSPARINQLIDSDERFWCYRLFGERV